MKNLVGFLAVNIYFVVLNAAFAGGIWLVYQLGRVLGWLDNMLVVQLLGLVALAAFIGFMIYSVSLIERWHRNRARAKA